MAGLIVGVPALAGPNPEPPEGGTPRWTLRSAEGEGGLGSRVSVYGTPTPEEEHADLNVASFSEARSRGVRASVFCALSPRLFPDS